MEAAVRFLIPTLMLLATPAAAQPYAAFHRQIDAQHVADAQAARGRDIAQTNDLSVLQDRVQTDEVLSRLAAARGASAVPTVPFNPKAPPPRIEMSQLAQIPDATLAASNARAVAASQNRH
jgi:hypothetical protein